MNIAIIISLKDPAGINIKKRLLEKCPFQKIEETFKDKDIYEIIINKNIARLYSTPIESVFCENIDKEILSTTGHPVDFFIFATKHQSKSGIRSLSCHSPGNWSKAEFGGSDNQLCISPAKIQSFAYLKLIDNKEKSDHKELKDYEIVMECTHHGPYLEKPVMFIEIGSTPEEWQDPLPGKIIAETIIDILENFNDIDKRFSQTAIGIGGQHTCSNIIKALERNNIAISHVCPKYMLKELDEIMLRQAFDRSLPTPDFAIVDWKGLGTKKEKIRLLLESTDITFQRTDQMFR